MSGFHTYTVGPFIRGLQGLSHVLRKAEEHAKSTNTSLDTYVNAALIADMKPLSFQIYITTNIAMKALSRATFVEPPAQEEDKTFEAFHARINDTIAALEKVDVESLKKTEGQSFKAPLGPKEYEMTADSYATIYAIPNFYFHLVTAYDILRVQGVPIGKMDYLSGFLKPLEGQ